MVVLDIVSLHVVLDGNGNDNGNDVNYADAHVVNDEVGWITWLISGTMANESGDDEDSSYSIFCYLFLYSSPLLELIQTRCNLSPIVLISNHDLLPLVFVMGF